MTLRRKSKTERFLEQASPLDATATLAAEAAGQHETTVEPTYEETILVTQLRPDPENPRRLHMTQALLLGDIDGMTAPEAERVQYIRNLASTILVEGLRQPVECYAFGSGVYRIVAGERRYWALMYNLLTASEELRQEREEVRVRVFRKPPRQVRRLQLTENIQREDLALGELYQSVLAAWNEHDTLSPGTPIGTASELGRVLALKRKVAFTIFKTHRQWPALEKMSLSGEIPHLSALEQLLALDDQALKRVLPKIAQHGYSRDLLQDMAAAEPAADRSVGRADKGRARKGKGGRPTDFVATAKLTESAAKAIFEAVRTTSPSLELPAQIDWSDRGQAKAAISALLEALNAAP